LFADVLKTTSPLVSKKILAYLAESFAWHRLSEQERQAAGLAPPRGIGYGVGLAFALFVMQEASSLVCALFDGVFLRALTWGYRNHR
jgi:ATP-binding cassette, subfamily C (CFTR/MRP), member 1